MAKPFNGVIKLDVRDSTPDWSRLRRRGRRRGAERAGRALRRHRARGLVAVRRPDQHADDAAARRQRPDLLAVAHDRAVLADALVLPHRPQPPPERLRLRSPRASTGFPGYNAHIPPENATMAEVLREAGWSTFWVGKNHNVPVDELDDGRVEEELAARPGLRPLLRLHRRRDQPLVSRPRRGQPLHRPAVHARGGLPPLQGPRRPGDPDASATRSRPTPDEALVHVVLPGRQPRAAPRARRSTSTSTRASSTTATRPTASGCCRG